MKDNKSPSGVVRGPEGGVTMCDKRAINYSDVMTIINSGRCYIAMPTMIMMTMCDELVTMCDKRAINYSGFRM